MQLLMLSDDAHVEEADVLLRERVAPELLENDHYAIQLAERLRWAAEDGERRARSQAAASS
jgi:hypothetical protein